MPRQDSEKAGGESATHSKLFGPLRNRPFPVMLVTCLETTPPIGCCYRIGDTVMQNHSTMRLIRFAVGMSVIAISAIGSAGASSRVERAQVIRQEAPANPRLVSVTDFRLSDRQQLKGYFLDSSRDRFR